MAHASPEIFPHSFETVVTEIGSLPDQAYNTLRSEVEGEAAFNTDSDRCERLSPVMQLPPEDIALVFRAIGFLYERIKHLHVENQSSDLLRRFVDGFEEVQLASEVRDKLIHRLAELTAPKEKVEIAHKIRRLRTGFLDNATAFSTFVDLRPDFQPGYESIRALIPVIQVMISTDSEDATRQHFVFQLDERGLAGLKKVVIQAEKKLDTLRNKGIEKLPVIFEREVR